MIISYDSFKAKTFYNFIKTKLKTSIVEMLNNATKTTNSATKWLVLLNAGNLPVNSDTLAQLYVCV